MRGQGYDGSALPTVGDRRPMTRKSANGLSTALTRCADQNKFKWLISKSQCPYSPRPAVLVPVLILVLALSHPQPPPPQPSSTRRFCHLPHDYVYVLVSHSIVCRFLFLSLSLPLSSTSCPPPPEEEEEEMKMTHQPYTTQPAARSSATVTATPCFTMPLLLYSSTATTHQHHLSLSSSSSMFLHRPTTFQSPRTVRRPRYHQPQSQPPRHPLSNPHTSTPTTTSTTITMSTSSGQLRKRITAVESAEKIVSALRLVAAARIRSSSRAALRTRPFAEELQLVLGQLLEQIDSRGIDIISVAQSIPSLTISDMHGPLLADPSVQKALLNRMYLAVFCPPSSTKYKTIITVICSERKFCGSYNKDVISRAIQRIYALTEAGETNVELVLVGRVARAHFDRQWPHIPVRAYLPGPTTLTAETIAADLSQTLLSEFIGNGDVRRVEIIYTRFVSLITTVPSIRTLLPLTPTGMEALGDEVLQLSLTTRNGHIIPIRSSNNSSSSRNNTHEHEHQQSRNIHNHTSSATTTATNRTNFDSFSDKTTMLKQTLYAISDEEAILLLNSMVPMYFTSQLIRIVRESLASEQVSRLAAMTAATDNARELIATLRMQYNRQRQARITAEIIEVIANVAPY